ncbi:MAG TPA: SdrD B-like domain-containing protein, partial [Methanothrix sp.]|nr:SdrD B-like domain-containing protein [Methanothrix sp.]
VKVRDGKHNPEGDGSLDAGFEITLPPNDPPALQGLVPDKQSPQIAGETIAWTAAAADAESDPLAYQFLLDGQIMQDWSESSVWAWTTTEQQVGQHTVSVKVRDGKHNPEGDGSLDAAFEIAARAQPAAEEQKPAEEETTTAPVAEATAAVTTAAEEAVAPEAKAEEPAKPNEPPTLTGLTADMESPQFLGASVGWTAQAQDAEGDTLSYRFLVNGTPVADWQAEATWSWTPSVAGTSIITAQVKDGSHDGPQGEAGNISREFMIQTPLPETMPGAEPVVAAENATAPLTPVQNATENATANATVEPAAAEAVTPSPDTLIPPAENITKPITAPEAAENITEQEAAAEAEEQPAANETQEAPAAVNLTPVMNSFEPDAASPMPPGSSITWTASATDAEADPLLFRFFKSGPTTGGQWQPVSEWSSTATWTWSSTAADSGENQFKVQVRDGKHAAEDGFDGELSAYFTISVPKKNISGTVYEDRNANSLPDSGEGLAGWTVRLAGAGGEVAALTGDDGSYRFEQLDAGSYTVSEDLASGWKAVTPVSGSISVELAGEDAAGKDFANKLSSFSISGMKYNDLDGNGANDGEPGLEGWKITLSGPAQKEATTAQDGSYRFDGLAPGTYTIAEVEQSGWAKTAPQEGSHSVAIADADVTGKDFGNHGSWSISGSVFFDSNGNGAKDAGESAQAGWSIQLAKDGGVVNATSSAADGSYAFKNLAPGKYTVSGVAQEGWAVSLPAEGSYSIDLSNADVTGKDFAIRGDLTVSGQKYYDINGNGAQDADEPGIPGGDVGLLLDGKVVANTTTDDNGIYSFKNVLPGTYTINDPLPSGLVLTTSSSVIVTVSGNTVVKANFGIAGMYAISGMKYNDKNVNGAKDAGEGEGGWDIVLTGTTWFGKPLQPRTTTTAADGSYKFDKLIPGTYKISETSRTGWTQIAPASGSYSITFPFKSPPTESKNNDFGNRVLAQSISGVKYNDANGNGNRDAGETGLNGWTINLEQPAGTVVQTAVTAADGSYSFTGLSAGTYVISEALQPGWTQKAPPGGKHTVTLTGSTSSAGGKDFGNYNNNQPPKNPTLVSDKPSPQKAGVPVVWTAGATDPESDPLLFKFYVKGPSTGGVLQPQTDWTASSVWTWSTGVFTSGSYQVEVRIRDGKHAGPDGFDAKKAVSFTLSSPNQPPRVDVLFSDRPAPQYSGSWIRWTALASDAEGDPLQYRFFLRGPSTSGFWVDQTGWSKNNRWTWRTDGWDVGYSEILVAVRDGKHAGPSGSDDYDLSAYTIVSLNQPPVVTSLASSLSSPQAVGATVWWKATSMDPEGNAVFYRYWIKGPATGYAWRLVRDWSTDPNWMWMTSSADAGSSEIQVQVRDGLHSSAAGWDDDAGALFTVLRANQPPALVSLMPDRPSSQAAGATIKWTAVASDSDREPVYYKFWLKGPSTKNAWKAVQDWSTKNQWTMATSGNDAGAYTVYVYARDGKHNPATGYDSALGAPYQLTPNQAPTLKALTPDKKSPQSAGSFIKWTATATDANKDPISYRFWLKGPSTGNAWKVVQDWSVSNQWTWTSAGSDSGAYSVYVYVRDGKHSAANSYDSALGAQYQLTENQPPVLTALKSDKASPQRAGTTIKWTATATDANKDPVSYQFWLRGPSTGNVWLKVQDWSTKNQWTWVNTPINAGSYRVYVYVRDGKHNPATGYDSALGQDFTLTSSFTITRTVVNIGRVR